MHFRTLLLAVAASLFLFAAGSVAARDFVFKDTQGQMQRLSDYRGKWVLVNFWATWCPPCMVEVPDLIALHNAHKDKDLVVIGVSLDSTRAAVNKFVVKHGITYPVVVGDYKLASQVGEVEALPTSYLYDPNGKAVVAHTGIVTQASLEEYIRARSAK
jgi:thiol-disulfide isomerase/thioredoxin